MASPVGLNGRPWTIQGVTAREIGGYHEIRVKLHELEIIAIDACMGKIDYLLNTQSLSNEMAREVDDNLQFLRSKRRFHISKRKTCMENVRNQLNQRVNVQ